MKLSILLPPETRELEEALAGVARAEQLGFHSVMLGCGNHMDPLTVFALARERSERIVLTPNIMPTFTRHPLVMAMQARTTQAAVRGRLRLGLGPGHASVIEAGWGLRFDRLIRHVQEYFAVLQLPECVRVERCQTCFHELTRQADGDLPFHWRVRRQKGSTAAVLDLESLRALFDRLGEPVAPSGDLEGIDESRETGAPDDSDAGETAAGLRYLVALLLLRKRRLKMVDAQTPEQEDADLVVVDPKVEGMEPVALFAPELGSERLAGLREELMAAIGEDESESHTAGVNAEP